MKEVQATEQSQEEADAQFQTVVALSQLQQVEIRNVIEHLGGAVQKALTSTNSESVLWALGGVENALDKALKTMRAIEREYGKQKLIAELKSGGYKKDS